MPFGREHHTSTRVLTGVLMFLAIQAFYPDVAAGKDHPKVVVKKRTIELGPVRQGEKATATFVLSNEGEAILTIESVRAGCGCTVPKTLTAEEKQMHPGETLAVPVTFDSSGRFGKQRKSVTVLTNDPVEPRLQLYLTAEVVTLFEMEWKGRPARRVTFGALRPGSKPAPSCPGSCDPPATRARAGRPRKYARRVRARRSCPARN